MEYIKDDVPITFITGGAGTGKSYTIRQYIKENSKDKNIAVTASTGIAAFNIGGQTIHSYLQLDAEQFKKGASFKDMKGAFFAKANVKKNKYKLSTLQDSFRYIINANTIIIDEISMINAKTLDYIDYLLRAIKNDKNKYKGTYNAPPFGGKKIIIVGDLFQLPPVEGDFFFNSQIWKECKHQIINLTKSYRQKDDTQFTDVLNRIRVGNQTEDDIKYINNKIPKNPNEQFWENKMYLMAYNEELGRCNTKFLNKLEGQEVEFIATDELYDIKYTSKFIVDKTLKLKQNAKVMLLKNLDVSKGLVNGAIGYCLDFIDDYILCDFNGQEVRIEKEKFTEKDGDIEIATRWQYPLKLAYGLTVHKSQGQTLNDIVLYEPNHMKQAGQFYTAISRTKKYEMLHITNTFEKSNLTTNQIVKRWCLDEGLI